MANEVIPYWKPGDSVTARTSAAVTGGTFVRISGNPTGGDAASGGLPTVAPAAGGDPTFGVAAWDAAGGVDVLVYGAPGTIVPVTAGAPIAAGDELASGVDGRAVPAGGGAPRGLALSDAADGGTVMVKLY